MKTQRILFALSLIFTLFTSSTLGQVLVNQTLRSGSLPTGWSQSNIGYSTAAGGYARFAGTNSVLTTPTFNASANASIDIKFSVAKFGSGGDGPVTVEYSLDGGANWTIEGNSTTPTNANYQNNTISVNATSATMKVRFTRASSPSQKRLRDVEIIGVGTSAPPPSTPTITLSESTISGLNYEPGDGPSANQMFTASGTNLTANILLTAPTDFEISTDGSNFFTSRTLSESGGDVTATTIYVRLKSGLSENVYSGTLSATSTGATSENISLNGKVSSPPCFEEDFSTLALGSYTTGDFTVDGETWSGTDVFQESSGNSFGGTGKAIRINDDKTNANLTTPSLEKPQMFSFQYRELNSGGGTFQVQKSVDGGAFTTVCSQSFSGTTFSSYSCAINESSNDVKIRILNNHQDGHLIIDNIEVTCLIVTCDNPSWYYRTSASGNWSDAATWEYSSNGSTGWSAATCAPDDEANEITISDGHTVEISADLTVDQLTVEENATLEWTGGDLDILNGTGDDLTIYGTFQHNLAATAPYATGSVIRVKTGGVLEVNNNNSSASHYGTSTQIYYEDDAVFYWNVSISALFPTSGQTYFPNAAANEIPVFRTNTPNMSVGAGSVTRINGYFEVENNTVTWQNGGDKVFRNGLGGNGNITQSATSGRFLMDGDTAYIAGTGTINLDVAERLQTDGAVYVQLLSDKTINVGQLRITNPATLDAQGFELSGSADIQLNAEATLITKHADGVDGSIGGLIGGVMYDTDQAQTIIFERNGAQNAGTTSLSPILGDVLVRNGSKLTLQQDVSIENKTNGSFIVDGASSELRASSGVELNIKGNRFFTLQNGATMHDNCLDELTLTTAGNSSTATFSGNGNEIKCWDFESSKTTEGGVVLTANTPLTCKNDLDLNKKGTATFTDNGNTITVGDDLKLDGDDAANFNFTGTIIFNGAGSGTTSTIQNGSDAIVGHLNNVIIQTPPSKPDVQINPQTGSQTTTIKGDLTIQSGNFMAHGNTIALGGDWVNNAGEASFSEGTSTVLFNGSSAQTITNTSGEVFYDVSLNKSAAGILDLDDDVEVTNSLSFTNGIITTNSNTLEISNDATDAIIGAGTSGVNKFVNGRLIRNTNNDSYSFPVGNTTYGVQAFSMEITGAGRILGYVESNTTSPLYDFAYCDIETTNTPNSEIGEGSAGTDGFLDQMEFDLSSPLQWNVTNPGGGVTEYDIELHANGSNDITPVVAADGTPIRFALKNGEPGNTNVSTGSVPNNFNEIGFMTCPNGYVLLGMNSFSEFTINGSSGSNTLLPVELLNFDAKVVRNQTAVSLEWETATELNNNYFTLERSADGFAWEILGTKDGAGTTVESISYDFMDENPLAGISYYRLKQTDFDGAYEYFDIRAVEINTAEKELLFRVNTLGQQVNESYKGIVLLHYSDGSTIKVLQQ